MAARPAARIPFKQSQRIECFGALRGPAAAAASGVGGPCGRPAGASTEPPCTRRGNARVQPQLAGCTAGGGAWLFRVNYSLGADRVGPLASPWLQSAPPLPPWLGDASICGPPPASSPPRRCYSTCACVFQLCTTHRAPGAAAAAAQPRSARAAAALPSSRRHRCLPLAATAAVMSRTAMKASTTWSVT